MKKVVLQRAWSDKRATLGMLTIVGVEHDPFFTLENPDRESVVDERIPHGTYRCVPYSGTKYRNVYQVKDVPGRSAILLHWGNVEKDTLGCILVGNVGGMLGVDPAVLNSKTAFEKFRQLIGDEEFELELRPFEA